jgi:hypothetical protein
VLNGTNGNVYEHTLASSTGWSSAGASSISSLVSDATCNVFDLSYGGTVYQHVLGANSTGWNYAGAANISSLVNGASGNVFALGSDHHAKEYDGNHSWHTASNFVILPT